VIKSPTVFVVGAGASVPFDFPTGRELLRKYKDFNPDALPGLAPGVSRQEVNQLHIALRQSEDSSIDALLEYRPDLERAGKLVIASVLLDKELGCINTTVRENDWIQYLLDLMTEGAHGVDEFASGNPVTFVTYNYDRLIEYKMTNHLRAKWRAGDDKLLQLLQRIPIVHLHGQLGTITPSAEQVPFGALVGERKPSDDVDPRTPLIVRASDSIRIVHQVKDNDAAFAAARSALNKAHTIFSLGFGFGPENVRRLDLTNLPQSGTLYATRTNMTDQEFTKYFTEPLQRASRSQLIGGGSPTQTNEWDCLKLLRERVGALI
jgi:hypothetical protein